MANTDFTLLLMKYIFSGVLLLIGVYGVWTICRAYIRTRTWKTFLSWPFYMALALLVIGMLLLLADHRQSYDFLNLVKIISGMFTIIYGIYATLNDFYETDETGRRAITKIGLVGVVLFLASAFLSMGADYVKRGIEKQKIEERRQYLANILNKVVFVDKSTGNLSINFQRFSDKLFADIQKANRELLETKKILADREGRLAALEKELIDARMSLNSKSAQLTETEKDLSATTARLNDARQRLANADKELVSTQGKLSTTRQTLAGREASLGEAQTLVREQKSKLERLDHELHQTREELQVRSTELNAARHNLTDRERRLAKYDAEIERLQHALLAAEKKSASETALLAGERNENATLKSRLKSVDQELALTRKEFSKNLAALASSQKELNLLISRLQPPKSVPEEKSPQSPKSPDPEPKSEEK